MNAGEQPTSGYFSLDFLISASNLVLNDQSECESFILKICISDRHIGLDDNLERKNLCLSRDSNPDLQFSVLAA